MYIDIITEAVIIYMIEEFRLEHTTYNNVATESIKGKEYYIYLEGN